jgi:ubiquinone biosynthesis monooxygenase Coq6
MSLSLSSSSASSFFEMHENYASIVWSTHPAHADWLVSLPTEQFQAELQHAFVSQHKAEGILSSVLQAFPQPIPPQIDAVLGNRGAFPLRLAQSTSYVKPRLALIGSVLFSSSLLLHKHPLWFSVFSSFPFVLFSFIPFYRDAAHTIHPLAGQGVNLGFGDAVALTNAMISAVETGRDLGDLAVLEEYESSTFKANSGMLTIVDGVKAVFSSQFPPLVLLRSLGLATSNQISPLKELFVRVASGEFTSSSLNQFLSRV